MYTKLRLIDPPWDWSFLDLLSGDFLNGYRKVGLFRKRRVNMQQLYLLNGMVGKETLL